MTLFDAYLIVDWSASARPKTGKDSIWLAYGERGSTYPAENLQTRRAARDRVLEILLNAAESELRVLVGFDFPYGYPAAFARALGLQGDPWRAVWDELSRLIEDDATNASNRWAVAAALNARLGAASGPFWAVPKRFARASLTSTCECVFPFDVGVERLEEYRLVEQRLRASKRNAHSAWKLFTAGSVGSQALLGIPVVRFLRDHPQLSTVSRVWPFETDSSGDPSPAAGAWIVHAEIWPGALPVDRALHAVPDAAQVLSLVRHLAAEDAAGILGDRFRLPVEGEERQRCEREEGWILGA